MDWHEHIVYEAPERDYLVQRRYYVDDARWSWVVIGDERRMTLTDNIGDVRVRMARLGRKRILAEAGKEQKRTDPWKVSFPAESGRQARMAGRLHLAVGWMLTALTGTHKLMKRPETSTRRKLWHIDSQCHGRTTAPSTEPKRTTRRRRRNIG
ncbi:Uncharacterised protein [Mycobacteroides abscessus subsp. massiliense]|nr:Uncharacterised protein [Mycobacteroides abscessus subsp. massiliense]SKR85549.1 Uncharacterised protein [Mycobacteroides abscessus subsp. massiliense]SKT72290.1 Uncharacterised protein [Mycobacteroides abscessus subsp. massiliense]SKT89949.1 Uncharacterised protein [Mycobacteroides abscessus subsp. massiliense]SKZ94670.1 Uncharacterised protein [Mycobacteroides abscessus subsp. massiliense]